MINLVCEHCLIFAYVEQCRIIPPGLVATVLEELGLEPTNFIVATNPINFSPQEAKPLSVSGIPLDSPLPLRSHKASLEKEK